MSGLARSDLVSLQRQLSRVMAPGVEGYAHITHDGMEARMSCTAFSRYFVTEDCAPVAVADGELVVTARKLAAELREQASKIDAHLDALAVPS